MLSFSRFVNSAACILQAVAVYIVAVSAQAQESTNPSIPMTQSPLVTETEPTGSSEITEPDSLTQNQSSLFGGPWYERPKLTGDWLGTRTALAGNGITLDVSNTQ
ncbi:MAG: hypothetical protein ACK56J_06950 [Planctomycetota bacterium]|jgi:hypothetical protein